MDYTGEYGDYDQLEAGFVCGEGQLGFNGEHCTKLTCEPNPYSPGVTCYLSELHQIAVEGDGITCIYTHNKSTALAIVLNQKMVDIVPCPAFHLGDDVACIRGSQ